MTETMRQFLDDSRPLSPRAVIFLAASILGIIAWITASLFLKPPARSVWKGWATLSVSKTVPARTVLDVCAESGIARAVSLETSLNKNPAPAVNFLSFLGSEYQQTRANFFYDKTGAYRLYYIEDRAGSGRIAQAANRLRALGADCAVNISDKGGYAAGIVCVAAFAVFAALSKNRAMMISGGAVFAFFPFAARTAASGAASCLALYCLFLLQKVWFRRGFLTVWLKKMPAAAALASIVPAALASGFALFFFLTCAASVSALYILCNPRGFFGGKKSFEPRRIIPAAAAGTLSRRAAVLLAFPALAALAFFALSLISGALLPRAGSLFLPAPVAFSGAPGFSLEAYEGFEAASPRHNRELPSLTGLVTFSWRALTSPYRSLNDGTAEAQAGALVPAGETVSIPEFKQSESGAILPFSAQYVFDESFISSIISEAPYDGSPALEDVLMAQGRFAALDYVSGARGADAVSLALLAVSGILPLAGAVVFLKRKQFDGWSN